ncbi:hypothetical protein VSS74_01545 [Conexibacter stalactiti]|uniref:DUF1640 domain-containing protein n=1 Tax=Conexibacter stalactiti TaxID=1940611 RepID=A0ABU4HJY9_9ACTN|nr:hypothetical protein [Conexibacter stalactiti]MDW5593002.1 hypothetical protein [Conexibacter stalactiti]MEC5033643.1 hypothetical protein [Conexibacter stalactiti]
MLIQIRRSGIYLGVSFLPPTGSDQPLLPETGTASAQVHARAHDRGIKTGSRPDAPDHTYELLLAARRSEVELRGREVELRAREVELRAREVELGARQIELRAREVELRARETELQVRGERRRWMIEWATVGAFVVAVAEFIGCS